MPMVLRPDVHAVCVDDDVVVLDIAADAYLCLPGLAAVWAAGVAPDGAVSDAALAGHLAESGLAGLGDPSPARRPPPLPGGSAGDPHALSPTSTELRALAGALVDVLLHYRGRNLAHILGAVRRVGPRPADREQVVRLSRLFARLVVWLPIPGKCLVRSFVLLRFLQRCGQDAAWCFGVRTWPFSAHCWLQHGDLVLDDHPDQLRPYTVIHAQ